MTPRLRRELIQRLTRDARTIASRFGLEYRSIEAERANVKSRYGICYEDGTIKIRLTHAVSGQPLKYSSLVSTLCHELAHLRHFDHGPRFKRLYQQMLEWSRANGIYRPSPTARAGYPPLMERPVISKRGQAPPGPSRPAAAGEPFEIGARPPRQLELFG